MDVDVCILPICVTQFLLYLRGTVVRLTQRHIAIHPDMHIYRITVAYTPRAQMVRL